MLLTDALGLFGGAVLLGAVHGIEPGHGWPVAASYALDKTNQWLHGLAASLLLGVGHLVSSVAMVAVFFYAKSYFSLTQLDEPLTVFGGLQIGGPVSLVAGVVLVVLGIREYRHSHSHGSLGGVHEGSKGHSHGHGHDHDHSHDHDGSHADFDTAADRGLLGIAWFAFVLGFAHEEEFEIIALCAGSTYCLELMLAYALTVITGIVGLTLLLIGGYHRYEERVDRYAPYLPVFSATVLVLMGLGFVLGLF